MKPASRAEGDKLEHLYIKCLTQLQRTLGISSGSYFFPSAEERRPNSRFNPSTRSRGRISCTPTANQHPAPPDELFDGPHLSLHTDTSAGCKFRRCSLLLNELFVTPKEPILSRFRLLRDHLSSPCQPSRLLSQLGVQVESEMIRKAGGGIKMLDYKIRKPTGAGLCGDVHHPRF